MKKITSQLLEKSDLASQTSHIFLLKNKLNALTDDFVEGYNVWEKSKAQIIIQMAETLDKLQQLGEYDDDINTISTCISSILRGRGVSENQIDYVRQVLPLKYKNENLATRTGEKSPPSSTAATTTMQPVNIYQLQKELETLSNTELQEYALQTEQEDRHIRSNIKARKEVIEFVAIKKQVSLPRYKKVSAEVPPEHLQRETSLYEEAKEYSRYFYELHKYFEDIAQSIREFPPHTAELEQRTARKLQIFRHGVLKTLKLMLVPYTDKKWSASWVKWIDIHMTRLEQSKNYAGSKHALETGRFAVKIGKDGKPITFALDRGITREQVGDREPALFQMVQQMLLGIPMINALDDWSYSTYVMEEYDEAGNPIIKEQEGRSKDELAGGVNVPQ